MKFSTSLFITVILAATLYTINASSAETTASDISNATDETISPRKVNVSIATGVRAFPQVERWGQLPSPPSIALCVDVNLFRMRTDISYHLAAGVFHSTVGAGVVLTPVGKSASQTGGFQLNIPVLIDLGILTGTVEAEDGYNDDLFWLMGGPSVGADFIWWKAKRRGFTTSLKAGYQFRWDVNSNYANDYSYMEDRIGTMDISLLFGIVF